MIPFCFGYFLDRILLFAQAGLDVILLFVIHAIAGVTRVCYQSQFFLEMGFCKLFTLAGLEL
jgi:hypothetical protein